MALKKKEEIQKLEVLKEYTYELFPVEVTPILNKNPFHKNQSQKEKEDSIKELIEKNQTMTQKQKQIACTMIPYFIDNPYTDYQFLYERFNTLSVYEANLKDPSINGIYIPFLNTILIKENAKDTTFRHEFIHATSHYLEHSAIEEGFTTILQEEYGSYQDTYSEIATVVRMLIELIGIEPFLKADAQETISVISSELYNIIPDRKKAEKLLQSIKEIDKFTKEKQKNQMTVYQTYYDLLDEYYQAKYQESIYQNQKMNYYINYLNQNYQTDEYGHTYLEYLNPYYLKENRIPIIFGIYQETNQVTAYFAELEKNNNNYKTLIK